MDLIWRLTCAERACHDPVRRADQRPAQRRDVSLGFAHAVPAHAALV